MKEEGVRMVFQLTGLQRNTCYNVDKKIKEWRKELSSALLLSGNNKLYFYGIENHYNCS